MPFVHSLVRLPDRDKQGWCAPLELGEDCPHYVSFVVPVDDEGHSCDTYPGETVKFDGQEKSITSKELFHRGRDSFLLTIDESEFWFVVKPTQKSLRKLPYVGRLKHPDFR